MFKAKVIAAIAIFIFIVAAFDITGWIFEIPSFISLSPGGAAMNPLTAITFLAVAAWLWLENRNTRAKQVRWPQIVIAAFILVVGLLKLAAYAGLPVISIDRYLFGQVLKNQFSHNIVAPTTAFLFTLLGVVFLNIHGKRRFIVTINDLLIVIIFLLSYIGEIGYIYSLAPFYRIGPFVPMALNTSVCFTAAICAAFLLFTNSNVYKVVSSGELGGRVARMAIPFLLLLLPAFGYLLLLLQRAHIYDAAYGKAVDTAFLLSVVLLLVYLYARELNKKDLQRKKAEQDVAENEARYRSLVFALKEGVVYFNEDGSILFYNSSFAAITGYGQDDLMGRNVVDVFSLQEQKKPGDKKTGILNGTFDDGYETQLIHKDGRKVWVHVTARELVLENKPAAFFYTITDITERRRSAEDIEAFSASAAHDLNAPLARIEMLSDFLLSSGKEYFMGDDVELLEGISKTAKDLRVLLKDLLDFSRIGSEKIQRLPINMKEMATEVLESCIYLNPAAIVFVADMPGASGDPSAIKLVWINLVSNALKYSSKKDVAMIDIGCTKQDGRDTYYVKDNGAGFDMANASKLFAPFQRLHSGFEGNGLGLSIVKRVVEKHGGEIWAESQPDKNTIFYFTL